MTNQDFLNDIAERTTHSATMKAPTALEAQWENDMWNHINNLNDQNRQAFLNAPYHITAGDISYH